MNLRFLHIAILTAVLPWAASCTREKAPDVDGNDAVEVSLQVENPSSDIYTMKTKATPAEERALKNMYVYIFSKNGALKGFAAFNGGLDQSTSDTEGKYGSIKVRTIAGGRFIGRWVFYLQGNLSHNPFRRSADKPFAGSSPERQRELHPRAVSGTSVHPQAGNDPGFQQFPHDRSGK